MLKRLVLAALAGSIVIFILAGVSFGLLFADFFADHFPDEFVGVNRATVSYPLIFVSDLLYAAMLALLLDRIGVRTMGRGAMFGLLVGFTVALHFDLISAATTYLTSAPVVAVNVAISSVMSAAAGAVTATVLGRVERQSG